jgi:acetyltransferase-like isoleucine patch superfamily enzyme
MILNTIVAMFFDILRWLKKQIIFLKSYKKKTKYKSVFFKLGSYIDEETSFEGNNSVSYKTKIYKSLIGRGTYIGEENKFSRVEIGRFCSIGSRVRNVSGRHPVNIFVSTHPAFFSLEKQSGFSFTKQSKFEELKYVKNSKYLTVIGNDVWIGDDVILLDGVTIGDGAIIGTGSVVTKDLEPYSVNVGVPAKKIKYRFNENEIEFLLSHKWWENDFNWIKENYSLFENIDEYKKYINKRA